MKYTTPSIEVVTFNPSDAPRIGMQWWVDMDGSNEGYVALGQNWVPTNAAGFYLRYPNAAWANFNGVVDVYQCHDENIPGAIIYGTNNNINIVVDDKQSC